jgi:hypothetical protein
MEVDVGGCYHSNQSTVIPKDHSYVHIGRSNQPQNDSNNNEVVVHDALQVKVLLLLSLELTRNDLSSREVEVRFRGLSRLHI